MKEELMRWFLRGSAVCPYCGRVFWLAPLCPSCFDGNALLIQAVPPLSLRLRAFVWWLFFKPLPAWPRAKKRRPKK